MLSKDQLPPYAFSGLANAAQEAVGSFGHEVTLLVHGQLVVQQGLQILLCRAVLQPVGLQNVVVPGFIPPQMQHFAFLLVRLHEMSLKQLLQLIQVSMNVNTTSLSVTSPSFVSSVNLLVMHSASSSGLPMKTTKSVCPHFYPGVTSLQLDFCKWL